MMHWLLTVPSYVWSALITPIILVLLARTAARPAHPVDGWEVLTPGVGMRALSILALPLAVLFAGMGMASMIDGLRVRIDWILLILAPPLSLMMLYTAGYVFLVRVSFSQTHVRRRFLGQTSIHEWTDVAQIDRHWFYGPRLRLADGSNIQVWEYLRGFNDLLVAAELRGIPIVI